MPSTANPRAGPTPPPATIPSAPSGKPFKNQDSLLPLDRAKIKSIAVIGPNAADVHLGGYSADPGRGVSVLEGIQHKAGDTIQVSYAEGCKITTGVQGWESWHIDDVELGDPEEDTPRIAEAVRAAEAADVAVVVVGGNESTPHIPAPPQRDRWMVSMKRCPEFIEGLFRYLLVTVALAYCQRPLSFFRDRHIVECGMDSYDVDTTGPITMKDS